MLLFRTLLIFIAFFLTCNSSATSIQDTTLTKNTTIYDIHEFTQKGYKLSMKNQEKAYAYFTQGAQYFLSKKDTSAYLKCKLGLSEIEKRKGQFNKSFDILWNILPEASKIADKDPLIELHRKLGLLYGLYGKDSLSLKHFEIGIELGKNFNLKDNLISTYLLIASHFIKLEKHDTAIKYLDSCYINSKNKERLIYVDAYYGHIYTKKKDLRKADIYFKDLIPEFEQKNLAFIAMVYSFYAEYNLMLNKPDTAILYYKKSLQVIDSMKVHIEIKPMVLEQLAYLHLNKMDKTAAFNYMKASKEMSDSLFHTQSERNKELFEIKNKYQEDLTIKEEQISSQNRLLLLKDKASFRLKLLVALLFLLAVIAVFTFRQRYKIKKMTLNKETNEAILEIKNKELTANALQIIEKEHAVNELLATLKDNQTDKYKALTNKYTQNNEKIWDDFHLRFTQTNNKFYQRLLELHPKLTPNDLKCCALIKLKFDSKEMSHILGISLHSVHMARSRIRKKLNLLRDESLSNYLNKF